MKYKEVVKSVALDVRKKFSAENEIIYSWLMANIDNNVFSHDDDDHEEDVNPGEEFFLDVMNEAFPQEV